MSVTVITGAGGGMGRACVERFRGDRLLLVDIDEQALEVARVLAPGSECALVDLGSRASIDVLVRQVEASGGLHRLVHLAGVSPMMDGRGADPRGRSGGNGGPPRRHGRCRRSGLRRDLRRLHCRAPDARVAGGAGRPRRSDGTGPGRQIGAGAGRRARSGDGVRVGEARRGPAVPAFRRRVGGAWRPGRSPFLPASSTPPWAGSS